MQQERLLNPFMNQPAFWLWFGHAQRPGFEGAPNLAEECKGFRGPLGLGTEKLKSATKVV